MRATTVATGTGDPELAGWCLVDWNAGCTTDLAVLSGFSLTLVSSQSPPPGAFEISLKLIPGRSLAFLVESPSPVGRISFSIADVTIRTLSPPGAGAWWVRLSNLPDTGILRLELDKYCDEVTIRSLGFDCRVPPPAPSGRWGLFAGGLAVGVLAWLPAGGSIGEDR